MLLRVVGTSRPLSCTDKVPIDDYNSYNNTVYVSVFTPRRRHGVISFLENRVEIKYLNDGSEICFDFMISNYFILTFGT